MNFEVFRGLSAPYSSAELPKSEEEMQAQIASYHHMISFIVDRAANYNDRMDGAKSMMDRAAANVNAWLNEAGPDQINRLLPPLSAASTHRFFEWAESQPMSEEWIATLVASFMYETRRTQRDQPGIRQDVANRMVEIELASYASWHIFQLTQDGHNQAVRTHIKELQESTAELVGYFQQRLQDISNEVIAQQKESGEATRSLQSSRQAFENAGAAMHEALTDATSRLAAVDEKRKDVEAKIEALREGVQTTTAKALWNSRATASSRAFWISSAILAVFLVLIPVFAFVHLDAVLGVLRHIGDATLQGLPPDPTATQLAVASISRLVVVSTPLALYIWVIRLMVRFNSRSLVLADDARQRHTMMETYFHLIEERAASKEDRALILAALFRPSPGHGGDSVDPPNFTELLEKAMPKN
ncbi:hypothetical protein A6U87_24365 [Rhizobium sp. AC44/96]|uniref:DUF6161 domain-containing protein n=1 Tax=Rhizobium sp. AC44/96 TaxID=1841654 RepID=UPI00080FE0FC|nr:DUF6161 domain-containing protein [Rhizobium sp. AC44/96]OCJ15262.1 hypothetical protein A6U87_24365 [Rhizobium sp. AC44/96]